jgi:hypothetical protein
VKPLEAGERVLLQDVKGRRYLITLEQGATFHTHKGRLAHDQLIGADEGMVARTDLGQKLLVLRPTLADWVVKMPRGAQVIYPKVLALMVMAADVQPGLTVVEAGAGSGALTIALLQALSPGGRLHSFERRPDFADQARRNVERWFGKAPDGFRLHEGDVVDGIADLGPVDRVLLASGVGPMWTWLLLPLIVLLSAGVGATPVLFEDFGGRDQGVRRVAGHPLGVGQGHRDGLGHRPRLLEVREHHPVGGLDEVADDDRRVMYPAAANSVTRNQADELEPERIGEQAVRAR